MKFKLLLYRLFKATIFIKGFDGVLDLIASAVLFFSTSETISKIIPFLFREELLEDKNDIVANFLLNASQAFVADTQLFVVVYLTIHGLIKIGLALAFNSKNYRAYKIAEIILTILIGYQIYRFSHTFSIVLLLVTITDILTVILVNIESKKLKQVI
jgi:uncharacterized membrane protein